MATLYNKKTSVYLSAEQVDMLNRAADAEGLSRTALLRTALADYLQGKGWDLPGRTE